jgi:uncharacterized OsmC-like protein
MRALLLVALLACSCSTVPKTDSVVAKLRTDVASANAAATETSRHVDSARNSIERIDYKASRARSYFDN